MGKKDLIQQRALEEAYFVKNSHLSREDDKLPDVSNEWKDVHKFTKNLYLFINGSLPSAGEYKLEYNGIVKSIAVVCSAMDGKRGFIYKINNQKFDEITEEEKLEFLILVYQNILSTLEKEDSWWRSNIPSQEYLEDYFSYLDLPKGADYSDIYINDIKEHLEEKLLEFEEDLNVAQYSKATERKLNDLIKCAIDKYYHTDILGGILFPAKYIKPEDRDKEPKLDPFGELRSKDVFTSPELSLLGYDEKKRLLGILDDMVSGSVVKWREMMNTILEKKIEDSSLLIEEILNDPDELI